MEYKEFKKELRDRVQETMGDKVQVRFVTAEKNNQTSIEQLTCEEPGKNMKPAIRLEEFYERYLTEGMEWCVDTVVAIFGTRREVCEKELFRTWEEAKNKITVELVNHSWNEKMLRRVPHKDFLDLAVIFKLVLYETEYGSVQCIVTEALTDYWGINTKELLEVAVSNLYAQEFEIVSLTQEVEKMMGEDVDRNWKRNFIDSGKEELFVLSNKHRKYGASGMLRTDLLAGFAESQGCDLIILPSSVHELLLLPDRGNLSIDALREMVGAVNKETVAEEERLSDEIYILERSIVSAK